jgi:hypothetical protein
MGQHDGGQEIGRRTMCDKFDSFLYIGVPGWAVRLLELKRMLVHYGLKKW